MEGEQVDELTSTCANLKEIIDHNYNTEHYTPKTCLFWRQQKKMFTRKCPKGMRWPPLIIIND